MTINLSARQLLKAVEFLLLLAILGLLIWSQPWQSTSGETRKITVTGESTIEASPDEYLFSPYFEEKGTDQEAMKNSLTEQANDAVDAIKELGVAEERIKLDVSSFDRWFWDDGEEGVLTASLQVTVRDKELAQQVQDYLLDTEATGQLTPRASFSDDKRKELDNQAVALAIDDAKAKAELQATKFEASVGRVLEVSQNQNSIFPTALDRGMNLEANGAEQSSLPVLPGQNEYSQTVTVTYELR